MKKYNWYIIKETNFGENKLYIAQYYGREEGFECMVCNHGHNAYCFNVYYDYDMYQTWCYGKEHMPEIVKDLGSSREQIIDNEENLEKYLKESE
jgi:hypothetical protein